MSVITVKPFRISVFPSPWQPGGNVKVLFSFTDQEVIALNAARPLLSGTLWACKSFGEHYCQTEANSITDGQLYVNHTQGRTAGIRGPKGPSISAQLFQL